MLKQTNAAPTGSRSLAQVWRAELKKEVQATILKLGAVSLHKIQRAHKIGTQKAFAVFSDLEKEGFLMRSGGGFAINPQWQQHTTPACGHPSGGGELKPGSAGGSPALINNSKVELLP